MCVLSPWEREGIAREVLAALVKRELGLEVEPGKLADFVVEHWADVASLAHTIHNARRSAIAFTTAATAARPSSAAPPEGQPAAAGETAREA